MTVVDNETSQTSRQAVLDLLRRAAEAGDRELLTEVGQVAASGSEADVERLAGLEAHLANDVLKRVCEAMKLDFETTTERAAMAEIEGGLPRLESEKRAVAEAIQARIGWEPPAVFLKALFKRGLVNSQMRLQNPNPKTNYSDDLIGVDPETQKRNWLESLRLLVEFEKMTGETSEIKWRILLRAKPAHVDLEAELGRVRNEKGGP